MRSIVQKILEKMKGDGVREIVRVEKKLHKQTSCCTVEERNGDIPQDNEKWQKKHLESAKKKRQLLLWKR